MYIQKNIWLYFIFCSFFLCIPFSGFAENIKEGQRDRQQSRSSRLAKYGLSALSGLVVGSLGGYICGQFDNQMGCWGIICTWPLFASLRDFTLVCAEHEIQFSFGAEDKERSCLELMKTIARLTEWAVWFVVISDSRAFKVPSLPVEIHYASKIAL